MQCIRKRSVIERLIEITFSKGPTASQHSSGNIGLAAVVGSIIFFTLQTQAGRLQICRLAFEPKVSRSAIEETLFSNQTLSATLDRVFPPELQRLKEKSSEFLSDERVPLHVRKTFFAHLTHPDLRIIAFPSALQRLLSQGFGYGQLDAFLWQTDEPFELRYNPRDTRHRSNNGEQQMLAIERYSQSRPDLFSKRFTLVAPELDAHYNKKFEIFAHELAHVGASEYLNQNLSRFRDRMPDDFITQKKNGTFVVSENFFSFFQERSAYAFQWLIRAVSAYVSNGARVPPYSDRYQAYSSLNYGLGVEAQQLVPAVRRASNIQALRDYNIRDPRFLYLAHYSDQELMSRDFRYLAKSKYLLPGSLLKRITENQAAADEVDWAISRVQASGVIRYSFYNNRNRAGFFSSSEIVLGDLPRQFAHEKELLKELSSSPGLSKTTRQKAKRALEMIQAAEKAFE